MVIAGYALPLNRFGDGEQNDAVVDGVQTAAGGGDGEVIAAAAVPAGVGAGQPNAPGQSTSVNNVRAASPWSRLNRAS